MGSIYLNENDYQKSVKAAERTINMAILADIVIIAILVAAVFFILRGQIRKFRQGQCSGGCPGCNRSCSGCTNMPVNNVKK